jgi:membrane-bound lytic murein transglycosylase A
MPPDAPLGGTGPIYTAAGQAGRWRNVCSLAAAIPPGDSSAARIFFEQNFIAYEINNSAAITGHFEPEYPGSKNLARGYTVPIYARPADPALAALPRIDIDNRALYRKSPVTGYLTNPVDAYMLQLEGAGRLRLPNGNTLEVGFDGQNGAPNIPIGSLLVKAGDIAPNDVTFQSIYDWLTAHPVEAKTLMEQNPRYVYLRPLGVLPDNEGAPGALGVPVTAGRSLAVDRAFIPLGTPVFLATTDPLTQAPLNRLTIAQDTGGGIRGAASADLFFGAGAEAEAVAGRMHEQGALYLLLPRPDPGS